MKYYVNISGKTQTKNSDRNSAKNVLKVGNFETIEFQENKAADLGQILVSDLQSEII